MKTNVVILTKDHRSRWQDMGLDEQAFRAVFNSPGCGYIEYSIDDTDIQIAAPMDLIKVLQGSDQAQLALYVASSTSDQLHWDHATQDLFYFDQHGDGSWRKVIEDPYADLTGEEILAFHSLRKV